MAVIKLGEQIAFLRKQNKMTQEVLANALGVTNQTVSKWESAQCCPDISLLPDISRLFGVSVDELLGCRQSRPLSDLLLQIKGASGSGRQAWFAAALRFAYSFHAAVVTELMQETSGERGTKCEGILPEEDAPHAWGASCVVDRNFVSVRRGGSVFFSDNVLRETETKALGGLLSVLQMFSEPTCLKILFALHNLTVGREDACASAAEIAAEGKVSEKSAEQCLKESLSAYVREKSGTDGEKYSLEERYLPLAPLLSLLGGLEATTAG